MNNIDTAVEHVGRTEAQETEADYDLVGQYLHQIAQTPLLGAAEEVDLAKRIEAGLYAAKLLSDADDDPDTDVPATRDELELIARDGEQAKEHMNRANLRLVVSAARRYHRNAGVSFLDIVQDGNIGLMRAVEKFDYKRGYKFSTYAMWWIRQAIERGRAERTRAIRLPVHILESLSKLNRVERNLQFDLGREPTVEEIAADADLTKERIEYLREVSRDVVSLELPIGDDAETRIGDLIEDAGAVSAPDVVEFQGLGEELHSLIETLPRREAMVIRLRYGLSDGQTHSLQEVAHRVGLTRERVRQLEKESLQKLRDPRRNESLLAWAS